MGKHFGISRYEVQPLLMAKYSLSEKDWNRLTELWDRYGMRAKYIGPERTKSNHYFLQGILEHLALEWSNWSLGMSEELRTIIEKEFPQLKVDDKEFEID